MVNSSFQFKAISPGLWTMVDYFSWIGEKIYYDLFVDERYSNVQQVIDMCGDFHALGHTAFRVVLFW